MRCVSKEEARAEKARALEVFGRIGTVVGVGITRIDGGYGIKVNFREELAPDTELPEDVNGVPVKVEVVGRIQKR
ncbi:MAG: hypothetical protein AB1646_23325 [Thermodesulfobacteriota bacterium]